MDRTFLVPLASALALGLTSGCSSNGIVGEWLGVSVQIDSDFYRLPTVYTNVEDGVTYTETLGLVLVAEVDGRVAAGSYYEYTSSDGLFERDEYLNAGTWEKSGNAFALTFSDDEDELNMSCTVDRDKMQCDFTLTYEPGPGSGPTQQVIRWDLERD